ncbi:MAG: twin-arginine translocase TatA/TatE family subunit [Firmicutes bacterium]|nr:twin-arginine translocase TatA/TatE family subunit [Bacillota bacterium]
MPKIGPLEALVILAVILLIFGPSKLPGLAKAIGKSVVELKDSLRGKSPDEESPPGPPGNQG